MPRLSLSFYHNSVDLCYNTLMITLKAHAKINLYLDITGVLENGYHSLATIMQSISLWDRVSLRAANALSVHCPGVPPQKNSAFRAAQLFFSETGITGGVHIEIEKRIPSQAGLGGGSADAAAALLGLNELYGRPLCGEHLGRLALHIGADVPFFLAGGCQQCLGIGEILSPLENRLQPCYLIVQPGAGVSTPLAYRKYDEIGGTRGDLASCKAALAAGDMPAFCQATGNSLERAAKALCPGIADALDFLRRTAACAFMTGSGSACVGMYSKKSQAEEALHRANQLFPFAALAQNAGLGIFPM